jgi:drug/metabolite transporter (DMT)-like permease
MSVLLASLAALLFGTADFTGGFASRKNSIPAVLVWSQLAGLVLVLLFILVDRRAVPPSVTDGLFGAAAGLAGLGGLAFLYRGLSRGYVSIVSPLAALLGALTPLIAGFALGERLSVTAALGVALSLPAIVLVSWHGHIPVHLKDNRRTRESLRDGTLSGAFFGLFFVFISVPDPASGMWPLAVARMASISVMAAAVVLWPGKSGWQGRPGRPGKPDKPARGMPVPGTQLRKRAARLTIRGGVAVVAAAGLLDMAANIFLVLAFRQGLLTIVAVISSAYPVQTVVLSRLIFGERVGRIRIAGIALALAGIALMSA